PGGEVVVDDRIRVEAPADRGRPLVPGGRQPLAVLAQALARVHGGKRRRYPPGLERVRRIGPPTDLPHPELLARLQQRLVPRPPPPPPPPATPRAPPPRPPTGRRAPTRAGRPCRGAGRARAARQS